MNFKADVNTSSLAESKENFSSSGWSVMEYRGSTLLSLLFSLLCYFRVMTCYYEYHYLSLCHMAHKALTFSLHPLRFAARSLIVAYDCLPTASLLSSIDFSWSSSRFWLTLQSFNAELLLHYMSMVVLLI